MKTHLRRAGAALAVLALAAVARAPSPVHARGRLEVGDALPEKIELTAIDGKTKIGRDALAGGPALVVFFATYDEPCAEELPLIRDLAAKHPKLKVLAIACDQGGTAIVESFRDRHKLKFPIAMYTLDVIEAFGVEKVPTLFFVDSAGKVASRHDGFVEPAPLAKAAEKAISAK